MIRAFLSLVEDDLKLVTLFGATPRTTALTWRFADHSIREPFDSTDAVYIRRGITSQLNPASITICRYGPPTYTSPWVFWERGKSLELGKPVMGVCLYSDGCERYHPVPEGQTPGLLGCCGHCQDDTTGCSLSRLVRCRHE